MAKNLITKTALIEDLDRFTRNREFYRRVGRAWKRGYLLHGPPGAGKSSLVAAMANYLKFDVYDMDLKEIQCNSDLRRLLLGTGNRSIILVEGIDTSLDSAEGGYFIWYAKLQGRKDNSVHNQSQEPYRSDAIKTRTHGCVFK
ncbi:hypothetical protein V6N12_001249 [Hibiscus sabdariffa]|uniref:ATPase AAA-type core domain-containing protein n=1 Tax=Hibiscus sabdariffa TaxID=183260 RepID=A0ABR2C6R8_9ROSI